MSHRFELWNSRLEHWRLRLFVPLPSLPLTWCTMGLYREDQDSTPLCQALLKAFLLVALANMLRPLLSVQHDQPHTPLMSYNPTFSCLNEARFLFYSSVRNFVSLSVSHNCGYILLSIVITFEINAVLLYMEESFFISLVSKCIQISIRSWSPKSRFRNMHCHIVTNVNFIRRQRTSMLVI